jgi:N utilization substance protein A
MEAIVDDSQLSLAIGKKGQNVRLCAKLMNWKIDIKSEEEKRQEVESVMAALVVPGAPISALMEHGLTESILGKLTEAGIGTVEKLGSMTPEELEEIPGIGPKLVERIQVAVNGYYVQFEEVLEGDTAEGAAAAEPPVTEAPAGEGAAEVPVPVEVVEAVEAAPEAVAAEPAQTVDSAESAGESDTIKDSD